MQKTGVKQSAMTVPYLKEFESQALAVLKEKSADKQKLKELLKRYATRYAKEYFAGT